MQQKIPLIKASTAGRAAAAKTGRASASPRSPRKKGPERARLSRPLVIGLIIGLVVLAGAGVGVGVIVSGHAAASRVDDGLKLADYYAGKGTTTARSTFLTP